MASLNISMPDDMRQFVEQRVKQTNHATPTEYLRSLIREDQKRAEQDKLERMLLESVERGNPIVVKDLDAYFERKKKDMLKQLKARPTKQG